VHVCCFSEKIITGEKLKNDAGIFSCKIDRAGACFSEVGWYAYSLKFSAEKRRKRVYPEIPCKISLSPFLCAKKKGLQLK